MRRPVGAIVLTKVHHNFVLLMYLFCLTKLVHNQQVKTFKKRYNYNVPSCVPIVAAVFTWYAIILYLYCTTNWSQGFMCRPTIVKGMIYEMMHKRGKVSIVHRYKWNNNKNNGSSLVPTNNSTSHVPPLLHYL